MKVILLGELRGKGGEGDVVDVAQGYAENYLFRNKIAQPATPGNLKQLEQRRDSIAKREAERIANAEATKAILDEKLVKVDAKIGEEGQLFGSVTSQQIVAEIIMQPAITPLLAAAQKVGCRVHEGLPMLLCQIELMAAAMASRRVEP